MSRFEKLINEIADVVIEKIETKKHVKDVNKKLDFLDAYNYVTGGPCSPIAKNNYWKALKDNIGPVESVHDKYMQEALEKMAKKHAVKEEEILLKTLPIEKLEETRDKLNAEIKQRKSDEIAKEYTVVEVDLERLGRERDSINFVSVDSYDTLICLPHEYGLNTNKKERYVREGSQQ